MSEYIVQSSSLTAVADRLRAATGQTESLEFPDEFIATINILTEIPEAPNDSILFYSPNPFSLRTFSMAKGWDGILQYSTDHSVWNEWNGEVINAGKNGVLYKIFLKGTNCTTITNNLVSNRFVFVGNGIKCIGNFEYLLSTSAIMKSYAFAYLFDGCGNVDFDIILPYTTYTPSCFQFAFRRCTSMRKAPDLLASSIPSGCCNEMFLGCTSLVNPPIIAAQSVDIKGCLKMFSDCSNLTSVPVLNVTSVAQESLSSMFYGCRSLTALPALYSLSLGTSSYVSMFSGCSGIKISTTQSDEYQYEYRIPYTGTGTVGTNSLNNMFLGTGGTFVGTPTINTTYYTSNTVIPAT